MSYRVPFTTTFIYCPDKLPKQKIYEKFQEIQEKYKNEIVVEIEKDRGNEMYYLQGCYCSNDNSSYEVEDELNNWLTQFGINQKLFYFAHE